MRPHEDFDEFVRARQAALLRTAYLLTGNAQDAEDLVQTALIKAVPRWKKIEGAPEAYVRRILVNENIDRWRRRRWREVSVEQTPDVHAAESDHSDVLDLRAALGHLAPRQRAVVVLRYYEGHTEAETADLLGIAVGTVKSQTRDALRRLRTLLPTAVPLAGLPGSHEVEPCLSNRTSGIGVTRET